MRSPSVILETICLGSETLFIADRTDVVSRPSPRGLISLKTAKISVGYTTKRAQTLIGRVGQMLKTGHQHAKCALSQHQSWSKDTSRNQMCKGKCKGTSESGSRHCPQLPFMCSHLGLLASCWLDAFRGPDWIMWPGVSIRLHVPCQNLEGGKKDLHWD